MVSSCSAFTSSSWKSALDAESFVPPLLPALCLRQPWNLAVLVPSGLSEIPSPQQSWSTAAHQYGQYIVSNKSFSLSWNSSSFFICGIARRLFPFRIDRYCSSFLTSFVTIFLSSAVGIRAVPSPRCWWLHKQLELLHFWLPYSHHRRYKSVVVIYNIEYITSGTKITKK